jgi:sporulation protein YlmC with PRC-barrel domain
MLYSANTLRNSEVIGSDGSRIGHLIDAYAREESADISYLIVDSAPGRICLFPASSIAEYDTASRRLSLRVTPADAAECQRAPEGVPVTFRESEDPSAARLHVVSQVLGYGVEAVNGPIGRLADVLIDSEGLVMRYLVVDTRDWQPGSDKLIPMEWVRSVDWPRGRMFLKITQEKARQCQRAFAGTHFLHPG